MNDDELEAVRRRVRHLPPIEMEKFVELVKEQMRLNRELLGHDLGRVASDYVYGESGGSSLTLVYTEMARENTKHEAMLLSKRVESLSRTRPLTDADLRSPLIAGIPAATKARLHDLVARRQRDDPELPQKIDDMLKDTRRIQELSYLVDQQRERISTYLDEINRESSERLKYR